MSKNDEGNLYEEIKTATPTEIGVDECLSEDLFVFLHSPKPNFVTDLSCEKLNESANCDVELMWTLHAPEAVDLIKQFNVNCFYGNSTMKQVLDRHSTMTKFLKLPRGIYCIFEIEVNFIDSSINQSNQRVQLYIPGISGYPILTINSLNDSSIDVEWVDAELNNVGLVQNYQIILNDNFIAGEISPADRSANVPIQVHNHYSINLVARVSTTFGDNTTLQSNYLYISAGPRRRLISKDEFSRFTNMRSDTSSGIQPTEDIELTVQSKTDTSISLTWSISKSASEAASSYLIEWICAQGFESHKQTIESPATLSYTLEDLKPGLKYSLVLHVLDKHNHVVGKSKKLKEETNASISTPKIMLKASNFSYVTIIWSIPVCKGKTTIKHYNLYINGVMRTELESDITMYTFYDGQACHQYAFQIQAISFEEKYNSELSNTVTCIWPGCIPPSINKLIPLASNSIRISWINPTITEGVKIKHFRLLCYDSETEEISRCVNYIHPESRESEIFNIKKGKYFVRLETYVHGAQFAYVSEPLAIEPELGPDPPIIKATIKNLEERKQVIRTLLTLLKQKDASIRCLHFWSQKSVLGSEEQNNYLKCSNLLPVIENKIDQLSFQLAQSEGYVVLELKWTQTQKSSEQTSITGYKVLVDGKYYGRELDSTARSVLIKLDVIKALHRVAMISISSKPRLLSELSNVIEISTSSFRPFKYFCSVQNHQSFSGRTACSFKLSLQAERNNYTLRYNPGFCLKNTICPKFNLNELDKSEPVNFPQESNKTGIIVILCWMPICETSEEYFNYFINYVLLNKNKNIQFATMAYILMSNNNETNNETQVGKVRESVAAFDKTLDSSVRHLWCSDSGFINKESKRTLHRSKTGIIHDAVKILEIFSFPTVVILKQDNMVYKGRHCVDSVEDYHEYLDIIIQKSVLSYTYDPMDDCNDLEDMNSAPPKRAVAQNFTLNKDSTDKLKSVITSNISAHQ